jgi:hypothetical protein
VNGSDIAGYLFAAEPFCTSCIHDLFIPFDLIGGPERSTEDILDLVASGRGIQRHDETSFSTYEFPKPIYIPDVSGGDVCIFCGKSLLGREDPQE